MTQIPGADPQTPTMSDPHSRQGLPDRRWRQVALAAAGLLTVLVVLPVLAAIVATWGRSWLPSGDWAMIVLGTADTGSANTRLVGPYSRIGWSHPGPMLFWLLAAPYRLTGAASWTLMTTAAVVNLASLVGAMVFAWRRGGLVLTALVGLGLGMMVPSMVGAEVSGMLADPWNPWITVLPTALLVLAVVSVWAGDRVALPVAVAVGSFLVQSHVGFGPLVAALWTTAVVGAWRHGVVTRRWLLLGGLLPLVVLWLPPVIDQLFGSGNLWALVSGFGGQDRPLGLTGALEIAARQLALGGPWMGGGEPNVAGTGSVEGLPLTSLLVPVVVFVGAGALAVWRRCYRAVRLQAVVAIAAAAGAVAVSRITGDAFDYLLRWWWPLAGLWWVSAAWSLWQAAITPPVAPDAGGVGGVGEAGDANVVTRSRVVRGFQVALVVIALVVIAPLSLFAVVGVADAPSPAGDLEQVVGRASAAVGSALDQRGGTAVDNEVELHTSGGGSGWIGDAVGLQLVRDGWNVVVVRNDVNVGKWGLRRTRPVADLEWPADIDCPIRDGPASDRPASDGPASDRRRAVWVLGDPVRELPVGGTDATITRVFESDTAVGPVQVFVVG